MNNDPQEFKRLPRGFRYQYRMFPQFGSVKHYYEIVGERGAIHFHVTEHEDHKFTGQYSAGLECHYRFCPSWKKGHAPDHDDCPLLHGICWHDGTSLYAQETLLHFFDGKDHVSMFARLLQEMERFNEEPTE